MERWQKGACECCITGDEQITAVKKGDHIGGRSNYPSGTVASPSGETLEEGEAKSECFCAVVIAKKSQRKIITEWCADRATKKGDGVSNERQATSYLKASEPGAPNEIKVSDGLLGARRLPGRFCGSAKQPA